MPQTFLVTGATGNVGGACARFLLEHGHGQGHTIKCMVRNVTAEPCLKLQEMGAELVPGDFSDPASLDVALEGVDAAFLACSNSPEQVTFECNFIQAASAAQTPKTKTNHVYLVKLSTCGCAGYSSLDSKIVYGAWHAQIEAALLEEEETIRWTILQPNCFFQNHIGDMFALSNHNTLSYPRNASQVDGGRAMSVDARDVGEIAAKLLLLVDDDVDNDNVLAHHGKRYDVCGPKNWSVRDLATLYETVLGWMPGSITCATLSEEEYAALLEKSAGFPPWLATSVAHSQSAFWAQGKLDYPSSDAVKALHPKFRTLEEWVAEHASMVSSNHFEVTKRGRHIE